jgi:hypothetical protein
MGWQAHLKSSAALGFAFLAFAKFLKEAKQHEPLLFREDEGGLFHGGRMFPKGRGDQPAALRCEFDQTHAPVVSIPPFHKGLPLQPIDRDTDRSGREPYFGADGIDGQRSLVEEHLEYTEIRIAQARPAQVQALFRVSGPGPKRLREYQPDVNPGCVLHSSASLPHLNASTY